MNNELSQIDVPVLSETTTAHKQEFTAAAWGDPFFELVPSQGTSVRNKGNVKPSFPHFVPSQAGQPSSGLFRGTGFSLALLQALQSTKIIITLLLKERREKINS